VYFNRFSFQSFIAYCSDSVSLTQNADAGLIYDDLHGLMVKTTGVADVIRAALAPFAGQIKTAFIFGSFADRTERIASDVDLMMIGEFDTDEVMSSLSAAEKILRREINPVVYPQAEFEQKIRNDHHFLKTVMDGDKIFLVGDVNELAGLA
jgi:predicted nucleotidyltransferase